MKFLAAAIPGVMVIDLVQGSISRNVMRGTLRGMHLQLGPTPEEKLIRCTRGSVVPVSS